MYAPQVLASSHETDWSRGVRRWSVLDESPCEAGPGGTFERHREYRCFKQEDPSAFDLSLQMDRNGDEPEAFTVLLDCDIECIARDKRGSATTKVLLCSTYAKDDLRLKLRLDSSPSSPA